ncbi:MAG: glycosyltransferase [Chromatiales bacterium]|nr:glycosyltransferase [Chromatiales bacterium]
MRISVWLTTYNSERYIAAAIDSVLAQTRPASEIVICDDGSSDGTRELLTAYANRHPGLFRIEFNERNLGITPNKTKVAGLCTGDLVTWLDADDRFLPRKLELESDALLTHSDAGFAFSNVRLVDSDGTPLSEWDFSRAFGAGGPVPRDTLVGALLRPSRFTAHLRNELVHRCLIPTPAFDPRIRLWQDWDARVSLAIEHPGIYVPETLQEYRRTDESCSVTHTVASLEDMVYAAEKFHDTIAALPPDAATKSRWDFVQISLQKYRELGQVSRRDAARARRALARLAFRHPRIFAHFYFRPS